MYHGTSPHDAAAVLIENNGVPPEWGCNPFSSNFTDFNEWYPWGISWSGFHRLVSTYDLPDSKPGRRGCGGWGTLKSQNWKCQDLPKFQFVGGGGGWGGWVDTLSQVKTQSAKICLNFNFHWGEGGTLLFWEWGTLRILNQILNQIFNHSS